MSSNPSTEDALACPSCARGYAADERFCDDCGMPLVQRGGAGEASRTDAQQRARKIRPEFSRGDLVQVAGGRNLMEAELIQNLLIEEGVPSVLRRSAGFDVPDFLASGPRDVLVAESGLEAARDMLFAADLGARGASPAPRGHHMILRLVAGIVIAGLLAAIVARALMGVAA